MGVVDLKICICINLNKIKKKEDKIENLVFEAILQPT